jgi:hypothetical protein
MGKFEQIIIKADTINQFTPILSRFDGQGTAVSSGTTLSSDNPVMDIYLKLTYNNTATLSSFSSSSFPIFAKNTCLFKVYTGISRGGVLSYRRSIGFLRTINPVHGATEYLTLSNLSVSSHVQSSQADRKIIIVPLVNLDFTTLSSMLTETPKPFSYRTQQIILRTREY